MVAGRRVTRSATHAQNPRVASDSSAVSAATVTRRRGHLTRDQARLQALSPLAVLGRGYALALDPSGRVLRQAGQARLGQLISVRLGQGGLRARVEEVLP